MTYAEKGDRLVLRNRHVQGPSREARILEVMNEDGSPPYRVRWSDDGVEALVVPGPDAYVDHLAHGGEPHAEERTS